MRTDTRLLVLRERSLLSIGGLEDSKYNKSFNGGLVKRGGGCTLWISRTSGTKPWLAANQTVRRLHAGIHARSCRDINKNKKGGETRNHARGHV